MLLKNILMELFCGVNYRLCFLDNKFNVVCKSNVYNMNFYKTFDWLVTQFLDYEINGISLNDNTIIITILIKKEDFIKCM